MTDREFNERLQQIFDSTNKCGLGELMLFDKNFERFIETQRRRKIVFGRIKRICAKHKQSVFQISPREFVKLISYEDFKKQPQISDIIALGLKLYLRYTCGVCWEKPELKITGI